MQYLSIVIPAELRESRDREARAVRFAYGRSDNQTDAVETSCRNPTYTVAIIPDDVGGIASQRGLVPTDL